MSKIPKFWKGAERYDLQPEGGYKKRVEKPACRCDIRNLMTNGHEANCAEKKL